MLEDSNRHLEAKVADLEEQLARLLRAQFGSTTERLKPGEFEMEVPEAPPSPKESEGKVARTRRLRVRYTKEVEEILIPEEVKAHPENYVQLSEKATRVSKRVEFRPAHLVLHIIKRPGFALKGRSKEGWDAPVYAPAPVSILPGSNVDASVVAYMLHCKYSLHLPLNRQLKEFERLGLEGLSEGGSVPPGEENDIIALDVPDSYAELPQKIFAFFRHALASDREFGWLFKCDDDTYLAPHRLCELMDVHYDLVGDVSVTKRKAPSGGAGYLLTRAFVEKLVAEPSIPATGAEDLIVGERAVKLGARMQATGRLFLDNTRFPVPWNRQISAHWCTPNQMRAMHLAWDNKTDS